MSDSREVVLRLAVAHSEQRGTEIFVREMASAATGMAPGIFGSEGGRPHPSPLINYFSVLFPCQLLQPKIWIGSQESQDVPWVSLASFTPVHVPSAGSSEAKERQEMRKKRESLSGKVIPVPLVTLAYGRSGDKGDTSNIGLMARRPEFYELIYKNVTEEAVLNYMGHLVKGKVKRFLLPGIHGFNFVCTKALGGGGVSSLQVDRQGKAYAQMLLSMEVLTPVEWVDNVTKQRARL